MKKIIVGIHQPNFMPWIGYFIKIFRSDIFILLDDAQIQKKGASYTNRVSISIEGKEKYLTIPIKRHSGVWTIKNTQFINNTFKRTIIGSIQASYAKTPFFKEYKDWIYELVNYQADNLADYNINFIKLVSSKLGFDTKFMMSSDYNLQSIATDRLIKLIQIAEGNVYISGKGGDNYQEKDKFKNAKIDLIYNDIYEIEYNQQGTEAFINGLSIIDALFNIGVDELKQIICQNRLE